MSAPKNFRSKRDMAVYVRACLNGELEGTFSVRQDAESTIQKMGTDMSTIFVSWSAGPSWDEVKQYLTDLNITLHNRPVDFHLTHVGGTRSRIDLA